MGKYQIFNPGEYHDFERKEVEERLAHASGEKEMPNPFAGMMPPPGPMKEEEILAYNKFYNQYDPLYTDPEFAMAHGHPGVPAMPGFRLMAAGAKGMVPGFSKNIGDAFYYTNDGTDIRLYKNVYAGMVLTASTSELDFRDVTKSGSDIRIWYNGNSCEGVDQNGERVFSSVGNVRDCYRKIIDGSRRPTFSENMSEWCSYFPPGHVTTDEDWERIYKIWDNEAINGDKTPYWEDVDVGYEMPQTCSDGPVTHIHLMVWDSVGPRSLFSREQLRDRKTMDEIYYKDQYGAYLNETAIHYGGRNIPGSRMVWYNNTGSNLIYRTLTNFIGYKGRVSRYSWRFFPFFKELRTDPLCADMFNKVPGMEGRDCDRHGSEGDTIIGRAVITDKYVNEQGEHACEVMLWGEDLEGNIVQGCPSEIVLPSKND